MLDPEIHLPIGSGESADVYRLPRGQVIKLFRHDITQDLMQREYDAAELAARAGLRVARPLGWQTVQGRTGILFEDLPSRDMRQTLRFRPFTLLIGIKRLADYQATMHGVEAGPPLHDQRIILRHRIETAEVPDAWRSAAYARLDGLPDGDRLCHGDLHPGNAIETDDGLAVIDWLNACTGHPLADAARTELLIRYGRHSRLLQRSAIFRIPRDSAAWSYTSFYARAAGVGRADIAAWRLPVAVAWLQPRTSANVPLLRAAIERWL
ncbi:phosphotransferase family protein [Sphingomonas montanisoli]|uniref:phosphotransferase family protein n=1 Tax=Sphingomonas montanisoli TaxID=2606412 RepID=UPI0015E18DC6|nr:aminoglycoside phosphotransferase family protein [Sphingomonas montanisoli]